MTTIFCKDCEHSSGIDPTCSKNYIWMGDGRRTNFKEKGSIEEEPIEEKRYWELKKEIRSLKLVLKDLLELHRWKGEKHNFSSYIYWCLREEIKSVYP